MTNWKHTIVFLALTAVLLVLPFIIASADTLYDTELVENGGAESGTITDPVPYWTDETASGNRWSSSTTWSTWPPPAVGNRYFFLYNSGLGYALTGPLTQWVNLNGTEGSGLFESISAGSVTFRLSGYMYQNIGTGNEVKIVVEQYSFSNVLLSSSEIVNTAVNTGAMAACSFSTQLETGTRKLKVLLSPTLTDGCYAQYDEVSLKLFYNPTGSAPVFGSDFPATASVSQNTVYNHSFTITDADPGDVDNLTFSASTTNIDLVPSANVLVTGSGEDRTLIITPASNSTGEAYITITASDGVRSSQKTIHIVVYEYSVTNLVKNNRGTDGADGLMYWAGNLSNITAETNNGFILSAPDSYMYQDINLGQYYTVINEDVTYFDFYAYFPGDYGQVTAQFFTDLKCTNPVGSIFTVNSTVTEQLNKKIPVGALAVRITLSNTNANYTPVGIYAPYFRVVNDFPKFATISAQTARHAALTVPVKVYYTEPSVILTGASSDQSIIPDSSISTAGLDFDRSVTFTPVKDGTATITLTVNDGWKTATASFDVTVHEPATVTGVDTVAGYYAAGNVLTFAVHFSKTITGGTGSKLPLTIGSESVYADYYATNSAFGTILYRYTLLAGSEGAVSVGSAIDDPGSSIIGSDGYLADLSLNAAATGVMVVAAPTVTSSAVGGSTTYGTRVTFTATLACTDTLSGTIQFQSGGTAIGSPVPLSANAASYEAEANAFDVGSASITAVYVPSGSSYYFASLTSEAYALTVSRKPVSVVGFTATSRAYDGTTAVTLTGGTLSGVLSGDVVTLSCPSAGTAASKNVGTQTVTYTAVTISGTDAGNYVLSAQPTVSVTISPVSLSFTANVADKTYNGTMDATVTTVTFTGLVAGESLTSGTDYTAAGVFVKADIGADIRVTVTISLLSTTAAGNYTLSSSTADTTADITAKSVTLTGVAATDRTYDGTTSVVLTGGTLSGVEAADTANVGADLNAGVMADAKIGSAKPVTVNASLTGSKAGNYTLTQPTNVTVNISKAALILQSAVAADKAYDGTTDATVTSVTITGLVTGEALAAGTDYTVTGVFASADAGTGISVTVTVTLAATETAGNYILTSNTVDTTADVTQNGVTLSGVSAINRAYNGTTSVTLTGGVLSGVDTADAADVSFDLGTGTVASADAGNAKPVATSIVLTGSKADNYALSQPTGITVDISRAALTLTSFVITDKTYDSTADATVTAVTFGGLAAGESLISGTDYTATGVFADEDAGTDIDVTVTVSLLLTAKADNYTVSGTGSTKGNILPCALAGTVTIDNANTAGYPALVDAGDVLTVNTSAVSVPGTLAFSCQWYRNGAAVPGATAATYVIGNLSVDPEGTAFAAMITGTGNYTGTLGSAPTLVQTPYVSESCIVETANMVTVDLRPGSKLLSVDQLTRLIAFNAGKPIVCYGIGYILTFPVGSMHTFAGELNLDIQFNSGSDYWTIRNLAGNEFLIMLSFNHSGALPGTIQLPISIGVKYAGHTMQYWYFDPVAQRLVLQQTAITDQNGYLTVTQDHCSSYAVTYCSLPATGDPGDPLLWMLPAGLSAAGLLFVLLWHKRKRSLV